MAYFCFQPYSSNRNSKIPNGQTEIVKSEDRQDHGQQNETKDKHRKHNTTLLTKAGVTQYKNRRCGMIVHETATHQVTVEF